MSWLTAAIKAGTGLSKKPEGVFRAASQGAKEASPVSRHLLDVKAFSVAESAAHLPAFDKIVKQALAKGHGLSH